MEPCKGQNCGCTDGINHSVECQLEHAISYTGVENALKAIEENAKLREQLAEAEAKLVTRSEEFRQLLESAEAKLYAASEQKPMAHLHRTGGNIVECFYRGAALPAGREGLAAEFLDVLPLNRSVPLYAAPIPPADYQTWYNWREQSWTSSSKAQQERIAELERKLAEQQVAFLRYGKVIDTAELNTLLAQAREEGRKEAVPEGIVSVEASFDYEPGGIITPYLKVMFAKGTDSNELWKLRDKAKAMLAAAPKPEVKP